MRLPQWYQERKAVRQAVAERHDRQAERLDLAHRISGLLHGYPSGDEVITVRLGPDTCIGPLGGESEKMTVQIGTGQDARFYIVNVYANGVMASG